MRRRAARVPAVPSRAFCWQCPWSRARPSRGLSGSEGTRSGIGHERIDHHGHRKVPRPVMDAVSALVNLGYGQPQATAAIAAASRGAGENAETAQLIRLGLKELSK